MAPRFQTVVELFEWSTGRHGHRPIFGLGRQDRWTWVTRSELRDLVDRFRGGLAARGIGEGDRVALVAGNGVPWAVACYAVGGLGAALVPIDERWPAVEWESILRDCGARAAIGSTLAAYEQLGALKGRLPRLEHVIGLDLPKGEPDSYAALLRQGAVVPVPAVGPDPETCAAVVYAADVNGELKGIVLSHANVASNVSALCESFPLSADARTVSCLRWSTAAGQIAELHYVMVNGASAALPARTGDFARHMGEVRPTFLVADREVSRALSQLVLRQVLRQPGLLQYAFWDGIQLARRRAHGQRVGGLRRVELAFEERLLFSRIRKRFGGRLRCVIGAGEALEPEASALVDALGIPVFEGYGLSERGPTATAVSLNRPGQRKPGSVGKPLPGIRVAIDTSATADPADGEVIVYGPSVAKGYLDRPKENARRFTSDGGLRTGHVGRFDEEGFLFITGRVPGQQTRVDGRHAPRVAPVQRRR